MALQPEQLRRHLSFLYAFNTLGAVLGTLVTGFVLLRLYAVSTTLYLAVAINVGIGVVSLALQRRIDRQNAGAVHPSAGPEVAGGLQPAGDPGGPARSWILWGIGISGFCALGYEVLWTRVLTMAVGASVYGFTIMLAAFLTGIALGSHAFGLIVRLFRRAVATAVRATVWFGATQIIIGVTALVVTIYLRDIPVNAVRLQAYFLDSGVASFQARTWANFVLAFLYMIVPAFFMGAAFPIAAAALGSHRPTGQTTSQALSANTVGAIAGAAITGLLLIRVVGIERSLQILVIINVGLGLSVLASLRRWRWVPLIPAAAAVATIALLTASPGALRMWDQKYFAIFRSNQPDAFATPDMVREAADNTDVLYYSEGAEATVSVIKVKGGEQAFITNGRVEASSHVQARQVQFTLGHLPLLLHPNPKDVLVVGLGSGMTAGATTVHPSVESVTLVEIEPQVKGVARTFDAYNHHVLDSPKLKFVVNDGRNYLMTTTQTFDVITADPIHPWFRGAGSLYSSEYFALAAKHLRPGGIIAQWLPIYELSTADLASVVATFRQHFPHTLLWLTHYDAEIVGSADPFVIDEAALNQRLAEPAIAADLKPVTMGSAEELLSYFVMGTDGMKRFAEHAQLNTDDRPYLEYSAPFSIATPSVMESNVVALSALRESILPYLKPEPDPAARESQQERWGEQLTAARMGDHALALFLGRGATDPDAAVALRRVILEHPVYAPGRALWTEHEAAMALEPRLLEQASFRFVNDIGHPVVVQISAVLVPVSKTRASIMFVNNHAHAVYGQAYMDDYDREERAVKFSGDVMSAIRAAYDRIAMATSDSKSGLPPADPTLKSIRGVITTKVRGGQPEF
jgi:spermidine synthase